MLRRARLSFYSTGNAGGTRDVVASCWRVAIGGCCLSRVDRGPRRGSWPGMRCNMRYNVTAGCGLRVWRCRTRPSEWTVAGSADMARGCPEMDVEVGLDGSYYVQ